MLSYDDTMTALNAFHVAHRVVRRRRDEALNEMRLEDYRFYSDQVGKVIDAKFAALWDAAFHYGIDLKLPRRTRRYWR